MWKFVFVLILIIHALIHLLGFFKAYQIIPVSQLTKDISKINGIIWLVVAMLTITTAVLFATNNQSWFVMAIIAAIGSQILIISNWSEAKYGTWVNLIIILASGFHYGAVVFENSFRKDVYQNMENTRMLPEELLKESDIISLPEPVQNYIIYSGAINQPKVKNMKVIFEGEMREKGKDWFTFRSEQYNFFDNPARLFFMKAEMYGVTVPGYHRYVGGKASMDIRFFGLYPIVFKDGEVMDKTETVTLFNDMCLMSPATLIDTRISWQSIDRLSAKAIFTNHGTTITSILYFNDIGQLINFISDDRTEVTDMKQNPFLTPVSEYTKMNGRNVMSKGEAVWRHPEGDFTYGKFKLKEIIYNTTISP